MHEWHCLENRFRSLDRNLVKRLQIIDPRDEKISIEAWLKKTEWAKKQLTKMEVLRNCSVWTTNSRKKTNIKRSTLRNQHTTGFRSDHRQKELTDWSEKTILEKLLKMTCYAFVAIFATSYVARNFWSTKQNMNTKKYYIWWAFDNPLDERNWVSIFREEAFGKLTRSDIHLWEH